MDQSQTYCYIIVFMKFLKTQKFVITILNVPGMKYI